MAANLNFFIHLGECVIKIGTIGPNDLFAISINFLWQGDVTYSLWLRNNSIIKEFETKKNANYHFYLIFINSRHSKPFGQEIQPE